VYDSVCLIAAYETGKDRKLSVVIPCNIKHSLGSGKAKLCKGVMTSRLPTGETLKHPINFAALHPVCDFTNNHKFPSSRKLFILETIASLSFLLRVDQSWSSSSETYVKVDGF
jgi:hypothetical protein